MAQSLCWHFSTEDLYKLGSEQTVHFSSGCSIVYLANWQASSNSLSYSDRWNWPSWKSFPSGGFFVGSWSWRELEKIILWGRNNYFQAGDISKYNLNPGFPGQTFVWWGKIPKTYLPISLYPRLPRSRSLCVPPPASALTKRGERNVACGRKKRPSRRLIVAINIHFGKPFCLFFWEAKYYSQRITSI